MRKSCDGGNEKCGQQTSRSGAAYPELQEGWEKPFFGDGVKVNRLCNFESLCPKKLTVPEGKAKREREEESAHDHAGSHQGILYLSV